MPTDIQAIAWDERYAVGNPDIDDQHRRLFAIHNDIVAAMGGTPDPHRCRLAVRELADYAEYHFLTEEAVMRAHRFPRLNEHAREHREFVGVIHLLAERLHQDGDVIHDVARFVGHWILNHVILSDSLIRLHLRGSRN